MKRFLLLLPLLVLTSCKTIHVYVYIEEGATSELLIDQRGSDVQSKLKAALK